MIFSSFFLLVQGFNPPPLPLSGLTTKKLFFCVFSFTEISINQNFFSGLLSWEYENSHKCMFRIRWKTRRLPSRRFRHLNIKHTARYIDRTTLYKSFKIWEQNASKTFANLYVSCRIFEEKTQVDIRFICWFTFTTFKHSIWCVWFNPNSIPGLILFVFSELWGRSEYYWA